MHNFFFLFRVGKNIVNAASFLVRTLSEKSIDFAPNSSLHGGKPGRTKRKNLKKPKKEKEGEE